MCSSSHKISLICLKFKLLDETLPVHQVSNIEIESFCSQNTSESIKVLWIGHASCLINVENKIVLLDPVFSER